MTVILVAAGLFTAGVVTILWFRSAVTADDELERRLADALRQRAIREAETDPPAGQARAESGPPADQAQAECEEAPVSGARPAGRD